MNVEKVFKNNFLTPSFEKKMCSRVYVDKQVEVTDD